MEQVGSGEFPEKPQPNGFHAALAGELGAGSAGRHMHEATRELEVAVWAAAEGIATEDQLKLLDADPRAWRLTLERLLDDVEDNLDSVRELSGPERDQVVSDFEAELTRLEDAYELLTRAPDPSAAIVIADPPGEVRLQASWSAGQVVVWAAGPSAIPADNDGLADRLEAIGGPALGWSLHPHVRLPTGERAAALAIPVGESLG